MSDDSENETTNLRQAARKVLTGCMLILALFGMRLIVASQPGHARPAMAEVEGQPEMSNADDTLMLRNFSNLILAIGVLGISCLVMRPVLQESRIHPLERYNANWPLSRKLEAYTKLEAYAGLGFFVLQIVVLSLTRFGAVFEIRLAVTLIGEALFLLGAGWITWRIYRSAAEMTR